MILNHSKITDRKIPTVLNIHSRDFSNILLRFNVINYTTACFRRFYQITIDP